MGPLIAALRFVDRHRRLWSLLFLTGLLVACAGPALKMDAERPEPSFAMSPATTGLFAEAAQRIGEQHGAAGSGPG